MPKTQGESPMFLKMKFISESAPLCVVAKQRECPICLPFGRNNGSFVMIFADINADDVHNEISFLL